MKKGYGVLGKAYEIMLRNDPHDPNSIDHKLMREMILLEPDSYPTLYGGHPAAPDMKGHALYGFAQSFQGDTDSASIRNILTCTSKIAADYAIPFEEMRFGGTEQEILSRGTDWCADMARVAAVLLHCLGIPARILHLVNPQKAYHGHVVVEAFYEGKFGVLDPLYGYCFYEGQPLDAYTLMNEPEHLKGYDADYRDLFQRIAISEYDPLDAEKLGHIQAGDTVFTTAVVTDAPTVTPQLDQRLMSREEPRLSFDRAVYDLTLNQAVEALADAKQKHDQLERYYIDAMDYGRLNAIKQEVLEELPE